VIPAAPQRTCWACAHCTHEVSNGTDVIACTHQPEGAPAPLHPHAQRTKAGDADTNVCGVAGIFWEAKK